MNLNWRTMSKRVGLGGTLLASLVASAWAERLPDITLPPSSDDVEYESSDEVPPQIGNPVAAETVEPTLVPAVPQPLPQMAYPPNAPDGDEPPKLRVVPRRPRQTELGIPQDADTSIIRSLPDAEPSVEVVQERYADGAIRIERGMKQDAEGNYILHGDWKYHDPKGNILAEGRYADGEREGLWRRQLRANDALLLSSQPYKSFQAPFVSEANFVHGKLHGKWTISDAKQAIVHQIEFNDGVRHGMARWYHPNGKLAHEVPYHLGQLQGEARLWDANEKLVRTEQFESGRRHGLQTNLYPSGVKHVEAECLFAQIVVKTADEWWNSTLATYEAVGSDERHGRFTVWHPNGTKQREGNFVHGKAVDEMVWWYNNGQKQLEGHYDSGSAVGVWTWWHPNGQKSIAGKFAAGNPVGEWRWWQENGKLAQRVDLNSLQESERAAMLKKIPAPTSPLR